MSGSVHAEEVRALIDIAQTINAHLSINAVLESVMSVAKDVMAAEASSLFTIDEDTGELLFHIAQGEKAERVKTIRMQSGQGIVGHVVDSGEPLIVNDVANDSRWYAKPDEESGFRTRSILCVPLRSRERILGAIEILNKIDGPFTQKDLILCQAVAGQAAVAIENAAVEKRHQISADVLGGRVEPGASGQGTLDVDELRRHRVDPGVVAGPDGPTFEDHAVRRRPRHLKRREDLLGDVVLPPASGELLDDQTDGVPSLVEVLVRLAGRACEPVRAHRADALLQGVGLTR